VAAYRLRACRSHALRLRLSRLFLHARNAAANFCARLTDLPFTASVDGTLAFPAPENVALGGAPKIAGCGEGAALHESPVVHGGGAAGGEKHGTAVEQACASYTSTPASTSCEVNLLNVKKNTSLPFTLASKNPDSSGDVPADTNDTQPPDLALNVTLDAVQEPTPCDSNSYTSPVPFTS
jgi:hypothetical protein